MLDMRTGFMQRGVTPRAWSGLMLAVLLGVFAGLQPARADVVISEVMARTVVGNNSTDEYIELCNPATGPGNPIDVAGWQISEGDDTDDLIAWGSHPDGLAVPDGDSLVVDSTEIPDGSCALVLDPDYVDGGQPYADLIPPGTVILTVSLGGGSDRSLGDQLDSNDPLTLYDGLGLTQADVVDTYGTPVADDDPLLCDDDGFDAIPLEPRLGRSTYRVDLYGPDSETNWSRGAVTPGYRAIGGGGSTVVVDPDPGVGDFDTIGDAFDNSLEGTTIEVHGGTYAEYLLFREVVTVVAGGGIGSPVIEGNVCIDDLDDGATIDGMTITGRVYVHSTSADVLNNTFDGSTLGTEPPGAGAGDDDDSGGGGDDDDSAGADDDGPSGDGYSMPDCLAEVTTTAIEYSNASGTVDNNTITGAATGVHLTNSASPGVSANIVQDASYAGIRCSDGSQPHIVGNQVRGVGESGIYCTNDPTIEGNTVDGYDKGIWLKTSAASVFGNSVTATSFAGVLVEATALTIPQIYANSVFGNAGDGVQFMWADGVLSSNLIRDNGGVGVAVTGGFVNYIDETITGHPEILGNTIVGNGDDGIEIGGAIPGAVGQVAEPVVGGNIVVDNGSYGLRLADGANPQLYNNLFHQNTTGNHDGSGIGPTDVEADPLFVDATLGDYRLDGTSPGIDSGYLTTYPDNRDLVGNDRSIDGDGDGILAPDIGAIEYADYCPDADFDGYEDEACSSDVEVDCDDADGSVNPGAVEVWYDGVDQDCDGNDDDQDGDGSPAGLDCDDEDATVTDDCGDDDDSEGDDDDDSGGGDDDSGGGDDDDDATGDDDSEGDDDDNDATGDDDSGPLSGDDDDSAGLEEGEGCECSQGGSVISAPSWALLLLLGLFGLQRRGEYNG